MKWIFFSCGSLGLLPALFRFVWSPWGQHNEGLRRFPCREFVTLSRIDFLPTLQLLRPNQSLSTKSAELVSSISSKKNAKSTIFVLVKTFFTTHLVDHFSHVHKAKFAWWKMKSEKWHPFFITLFFHERNSARRSTR